jgi:hypothetical protein
MHHRALEQARRHTELILRAADGGNLSLANVACEAEHFFKDEKDATKKADVAHLWGNKDHQVIGIQGRSVANATSAQGLEERPDIALPEESIQHLHG